MEILSLGIIPFVFLSVNREALRGIKKIKEYMFFNQFGISLFSSIFLIIFTTIFFCFNLNDNLKNLIPLISLLFAITLLSFFSYFLWKNFSKSTDREKKALSSYLIEKKFLSYRRIISLSIPFLFSSTLGMIIGWTDILMLGVFEKEKNIGIYSIIQKIAMLTSIPAVAINIIVAPKLTEVWSKNELENLKNIAKKSARLMFLTSLPILLFVFFFPKFVLSIFGEEFVYGDLALRFLVVGQFINTITGSVGYILMMTGKEKTFQYIMFLTTVINIILNYIFIPIYGINGAVIATSISVSLINIISLFFVRYYYGFYTFF